ncbi:hypothetical protein BH24ACT12_BH24ACT12_11020 [soil metagenome]|jgi:hypothetical protein
MYWTLLVYGLGVTLTWPVPVAPDGLCCWPTVSTDADR